ncbi:MAG: hypothetical protein Q8K81_05055 [Sulfuricurvum sp.]|nr:hypothetical protein [Sulfuricurvum sp.]
MNTIHTFEDLQNLGVSVIHEQTHIARSKLESVLTKSFGELTRVQFMGFVSILEREYGMELSSLRDEYDQFVQSHPDTLIAKESVILQAQSRTRQKWILGGIIAIAVLVILGSMIQGNLTMAPSEEVMNLSSATVEVVDQNSDVIIPAEINTTVPIATVEANISLIKDEKNVTTVADTSIISLENAVSIKPISKVWVGMMDLSTGEKSQKITKDPIVIDTTKNWLFIFGHGRLEVATPSGNKTLKEKDTVWFSYENGKLQQLNDEQFRVKNKGSAW